MANIGLALWQLELCALRSPFLQEAALLDAILPWCCLLIWPPPSPWCVAGPADLASSLVIAGLPMWQSAGGCQPSDLDYFHGLVRPYLVASR